MMNILIIKNGWILILTTVRNDENTISFASIYVDKNLLQVNEYLIHEVIHYLQNFEKISKQIKRVGLCQFLEFKLWGLGINEAVVHYITSKAQGQKVHRINDKEISICTNSENNYKYITSFYLLTNKFQSFLFSIFLYPLFCIFK